MTLNKKKKKNALVLSGQIHKNVRRERKMEKAFGLRREK